MTWLLGICAVLEGVIALLNLLAMNPARNFHASAAIGAVAIAAGICAVAAARRNTWPLLLHGLALGSFGLIAISPLVRRPLSFRAISLLFVAMALAIALYGARKAVVAAVIGFAFAVSFAVVGLGRVRLEPGPYWVWMACFFGFCAAVLGWAALGLRAGRREPQRVFG